MVAPAPPAPVLPGIEDLEVVGRGGSSTVYRGRQPAMSRTVAVKLLDAGHGGPGSPAFDREVRALGSLSGHPNVVPVHDLGTVGDRPYLVMAYLSGGSLEDRLRQGALPAEEVVRVGVSVTAALEAAHERGVLHRDVKPANILFGTYGEVQLADFGIARFTDMTLTSGLVAATVAYAAPEVLMGEPASAASDVYSLGATLLAALLGHSPFVARPGEAPVAFALRTVSDDPPPCPGPPALAAVVRRAMARNPVDRFASAGEFRDALATARPGPPVPVRVQRRRARPAALAVATVAVVAGLAVAALATSTGTSRAAADRSAAGPPTTAAAAPTTHPPAPVAPAGAAVAAPSPVTSAPRAVPATSTPPTTDTPTPAAVAPAAGTPSTAGAVRQYYALVGAHRLSEAFAWLTPAYQQRIGYAYYSSFWGGISEVDVLRLDASPSSASITLRYVQSSGAVSTERATLSLVPGPGHPLIDTYTVG